MEKNRKPFVAGVIGLVFMILAGGWIVIAPSGCITPGCEGTYTNESLQPLAATSGDLARAVMKFVEEHPGEAAALNDRDLVIKATAYDEMLLKPYAKLVVRGRADGVILVCTCDGKRGLFEDAECTDTVDRMVWTDENAPCEFTLKTETLCK
jgi:hypothetical protein